jgi:hypothetical protein
MKKNFKILFVFLIIVASGCTNEVNSPGILCFTPPPSFKFEIVDKSTGVNLFTNGTYQSSQIAITDLSNNTKIPFTFVSENGLNLIQIENIGSKTEKINYSIIIQEKSIFGLYVDATRISGDCSYTKYNEILIKDAEFKLNQSTGIYKILVP